MDCRVVLEAAVPVYDVETPDQAVRIAISKTGEMLNPDLNYVEISIADRHCDHCGDERQPAFIAADEGLVALQLGMDVFNVDGEQHATRIARTEIGQRLAEIPLSLVSVVELPAGKDDAAATDVEPAPVSESTMESDARTAGDTVDDADAGASQDTETADILPEFEELLDE
jgi:uncharacterized protein (UPF0212 family)